MKNYFCWRFYGNTKKFYLEVSLYDQIHSIRVCWNVFKYNDIVKSMAWQCDEKYAKYNRSVYYTL